ncbi:glycosyltransferase [Algiphilus sp. NNCM1]|nr:glycosyltransferase [Algiphilus acroporae]
MYLIKGLGLGGAEKHVAQCALAWQRQGAEVRVAYVLPWKDAWARRLASQGVAVVCLAPRGAWPLAMLWHYWRLMKDFRPQLVHAHLPLTALLARIFKPLGRYRLVYTEHNELPRLHPLTRTIHRWSHRLDDAAISCSAAVARSLPWPSTIIDNGIALSPPPLDGLGLRRSLGFSARAVVVICVANMTPKKNHGLLLRAFNQAVLEMDEQVDLQLVLVGQDATEGSAVRALAGSLSSSERIHFFGPHPAAESLLPDADIFCLSSNQEGLPISLLEAMAAGLPSVVTCAGEMGRVVGEDCGLVVPVGDEAALAIALTELAGDECRRVTLGKRGREKVQECYSESTMLESLAEVYRNALGRAAASTMYDDNLP